MKSAHADQGKFSKLQLMSDDWLINRANYLHEKVNAYEIIINSLKEMQQRYRDKSTFIEVAEACISTIRSQQQYVLMKLNEITSELKRRGIDERGPSC